MDTSLLPGLLGAYGSEDDEEDNTSALPQPTQPSGRQEGETPAVQDISVSISETLRIPATLALPLSAAPDIIIIGDPPDASAIDGQSNSMDLESAEAQNSGSDPFWLPPEIANPPERKCSADVQEKVKEYILKQEETGNTITSSLKSLSGYKNPDFLQHCVKYDNIDQYGSCYPKDIFDPSNLPAEDFYDRLAYEWEERINARRNNLKASQKSEFISRGTEQIRNIPGGLQSGATAASMVAQAKALAASRSSKWDTRR